MSYWSQMGGKTRRHDYRLMNSGRSTVTGPSTMTGSRQGGGSLGSQPRQDVPGASGPGGPSFSGDSPLMASVRQVLLSSADSPAANAFRSCEEGPESRGTDQLEYVTMEDETTADIGDLEAELARERERQTSLDKERKVLELQAQIASLRAKNVAQEREIRARKLELSTALEASDHRERSSRVLSRTSRDLGQRAQGQGRSAHTTTTGNDPRSRMEKLMMGLSGRRSASPSPITSKERGPDSSDSGSSGAFLLSSRDRRCGKRKTSPPMSDSGSHCNRREGGKMHSGIKDRNMETVVNKQLYPHAALQQEYLWGWNGENIEIRKLLFGLFVAGKIEIIMGGSVNRNDAQRRLQMLKTMAYRAQYVEWSKLLHLHAAILAKIQTGIATWDSNFEQVEKMVLENPRKVDWSSRLGLRQPRTSGKNTGRDRPSNARISDRGMTGILCGGARTFSPAHVISQLLIQRAYLVGRSV